MDNSKGVPTHPWKALTALSFMEKMAVEDVFPAIYRSPPQPLTCKVERLDPT
jgi:hypothetical protein